MKCQRTFPSASASRCHSSAVTLLIGGMYTTRSGRTHRRYHVDALRSREAIGEEPVHGVGDLNSLRLDPEEVAGSGGLDQDAVGDRAGQSSAWVKETPPSARDAVVRVGRETAACACSRYLPNAGADWRMSLRKPRRRRSKSLQSIPSITGEECADGALGRGLTHVLFAYIGRDGGEVGEAGRQEDRAELQCLAFVRFPDHLLYDDSREGAARKGKHREGDDLRCAT